MLHTGLPVGCSLPLMVLLPFLQFIELNLVHLKKPSRPPRLTLASQIATTYQNQHMLARMLLGADGCMIK